MFKIKNFQKNQKVTKIRMLVKNWKNNGKTENLVVSDDLKNFLKFGKDQKLMGNENLKFQKIFEDQTVCKF